MRRTIYLQMLYLIDMHKSWIALDGSRSYVPRIIFKRGRVLLCTFRTIRLRAIYKHNGYERGTKWSISEYELDRALAVYRGCSIVVTSSNCGSWSGTKERKSS
jgi:hypothetical protein